MSGEYIFHVLWRQSATMIKFVLLYMKAAILFESQLHSWVGCVLVAAHLIAYMHMQLEVPKELVPSSILQELKEQRKPTFIPVSSETDATKLHDEETGITRRRLANGIPVNYKVCCVYITVFIIGVPYFPCSVIVLHSMLQGVFCSPSHILEIVAQSSWIPNSSTMLLLLNFVLFYIYGLHGDGTFHKINFYYICISNHFVIWFHKSNNMTCVLRFAWRTRNLHCLRRICFLFLCTY